MSCKVVTGVKWTPLIDTYLPPSTLEHLQYWEESLTRSRTQYPIVLGDLNTDICQVQNPWSQQVADLLTEFGRVDLLCHFRQFWWFWDLKMWYQVQQGIFYGQYSITSWVHIGSTSKWWEYGT